MNFKNYYDIITSKKEEGTTMKIAIIGYSGAGKSTLARKIGQKLEVNVLHLDSVHFSPNWVERDNEEEKNITLDFLNNNKSWVIDGNYSNVYYDRRLEEADKIIFINMNRLKCFIRVLKRYFKFKGQSRPSLASGCLEKVDKEFLMWVLFDGRTKKKKAKFKKIKNLYKDKIIVAKSQRQLYKIYDSFN